MRKIFFSFFISAGPDDIKGIPATIKKNRKGCDKVSSCCVSEASTPTFSTASGSLLHSTTYDSLSFRGELDEYHGQLKSGFGVVSRHEMRSRKVMLFVTFLRNFIVLYTKEWRKIR
jgi:hypothetical protein